MTTVDGPPLISLRRGDITQADDVDAIVMQLDLAAWEARNTAAPTAAEGWC